ncbi:MAG: CCA tRNA nucleotidyltransferase, partial [Actinomycetota bacterium]
MSSEGAPAEARDEAPVARIEPPAWSRSARARSVIAALSAGGAEPRFVGGCVRDQLAGQPVTDIEVATPEPPETVRARLEEAGIRAIPTGIEHGTITALLDRQPFEITTLRRDVETDGRHAVVAFT